MEIQLSFTMFRNEVSQTFKLPTIAREYAILTAPPRRGSTSVAAHQLRHGIDFSVIVTVSVSLALPCVNERDIGLSLAASDMCKVVKADVGQGRSLCIQLATRQHLAASAIAIFNGKTHHDSLALLNHSESPHLHSSSLTDNLKHRRLIQSLWLQSAR